MIEITHKQAQRMVRENLDRNLPDAQWAALHSHLEQCAVCREYGERFDGFDKEARRVLRVRWERVLGPEKMDGADIIHARRERSQFRRRVLAAGIGMPLLVIFWVMGGFELLSIPITGSDPLPIGIKETARPAAGLPTAQAGEFDNIVVFASSKDGNSDLYLLNTGGEPENLTGADPNSTVDETHPAWSPDGEWIAFLSNRTGKTEVFVTDMVKNQPVQLTNEAAVDWVGPLSWSADGRWISLTGVRREQGSQAWVYLVPVDGSGTRSLAFTRGGWAPEFSPDGGRLAYITGKDGQITMAVHALSGRDAFANNGRNRFWGGSTGQEQQTLTDMLHFDAPGQPDEDLAQFIGGTGLDWAPDGQGLAYINAGIGADGSLSTVMIERSPAVGSSLPAATLPSIRLAQSRWPLAFSGVTWSPGGAVVYLENLDDARAAIDPSLADPCWTLRQQRSDGGEGQRTGYLVGDFCVEGGLDRGSWSPDGGWLVLVGRRLGETEHSLYAVQVADGADEEEPPAEMLPETLLRLVGEGWQPVTPGVRPQGASLAIRPQPVRVWREAPPATEASRAPGEILYSLQHQTAGVIVSANPDGTGGQVLTSSLGENRCPRWSPDGRQVAFISDRSSGRQGGGVHLKTPAGHEIFIVSAGGEIDQVSNIGLIPETGQPGGVDGSTAVYGCPVWSPDGRYLAATLDSGQANYLVLLPLEDMRRQGVRTRYIRTGRTSSGPVWTPDGRKVVLAHKPEEGSQPRVLLASLPVRTGQPLSTETLAVSFDLDHIEGLAVSADGRQVYLLATSFNSRMERVSMLRRLSLEGAEGRSPVPVGSGFAVRGVSPGGLTRLPDGSLGMIWNGRPEQRYKSIIQRFDLKHNALETLAVFGDYINSAAWSPDGRWIIFSAESGLWLLDLQSSGRSQAAPVWISPQPVADLDWR